MLPSVIYKTGESDRLAISVAVGLNYQEDKPKHERLELSLMYLTPQSSSDLEKNYAVTTVSGQNVSECLKTLEGEVGKEIGLSHCQVLIISESLAKLGPISFLDSFTRTNDLTTNSLLICSDNPKDLIESQISESSKISLSLSNILEYINSNAFTRHMNLEKFYADYFDESGICYIPFVNTKGQDNKKDKQGSENSQQGEGNTNEGSSNISSSNDQSSNSAGSPSGSGSDSSGSSATGGSNSPSSTEPNTVGSQGPAEKMIFFDNTYGVFNRGKLVAKLDKDASQILNLLFAKAGKTTITLDQINTNYASVADVTINIENKTQYVGYNFINGYPVVSINMTLFCKISEVNTNEYTLDTVSVVNEQITDVIRKETTKYIEAKLSEAINFAKENDIDMFYIAKKFHRLCTKEWDAYKLQLDADDNYLQDVLFLFNLKLIER